jgi:hypothetical protein
MNIPGTNADIICRMTALLAALAPSERTRIESPKPIMTSTSVDTTDPLTPCVLVYLDSVSEGLLETCLILPKPES